MRGPAARPSSPRCWRSILRTAGLRVATWSSHGVDIEGVRQAGELGPWQEVERRAGRGTDRCRHPRGRLGDGVHARDRSAAAAAGRDERLRQPRGLHSRRATLKLADAAMPALLTAVVRQGWLILNGEDLAVAADLSSTGHNRLLVGLGLDGPLIEPHLARSSNLAWLAGDQLVVAHDGRVSELGDRNELDFALDGRANFMVFDTLMAASLATVMGIEADAIRAGLRRFRERSRFDPRFVQRTGDRQLSADPRYAIVLLAPQTSAPRVAGLPPRAFADCVQRIARRRSI